MHFVHDTIDLAVRCGTYIILNYYFENRVIKILTAILVPAIKITINFYLRHWKSKNNNSFDRKLYKCIFEIERVNFFYYSRRSYFTSTIAIY